MKQKPKGRCNNMQGQKPIKKYRSGNFELAFWENERPVNDALVSFTTMTLSKSFKKKDDDTWRNETIHIRRMDLPKIHVLINKGIEETYLTDTHEEEEDD